MLKRIKILLNLMIINPFSAKYIIFTLMKTKIFFHIALVITTSFLSAQTDSAFDSTPDYHVGIGKTYQPAPLDTALHIIQSENEITVRGYQVQILATNDYRTSQNTITNFKMDHPELYIVSDYKTPNYRIRVGAFRTQMEATKLWNELKGSYPGAFIVSDSQLNIKYLKN